MPGERITQQSRAVLIFADALPDWPHYPGFENGYSRRVNGMKTGCTPKVRVLNTPVGPGLTERDE